MKKLIYLILFVIPLSVVAQPSGGCGTFLDSVMWIPFNTKMIVDCDTLRITPPPGYIYIGYDAGGVIQRSTSGVTVSCDCRGSGECSPFAATTIFGDFYGCAGACDDCDMSVAGAANQFGGGSGFIDFTVRTDFLGKDEQRPAAFEAMFDLPEVQSNIKDFLDKFYSHGSSPPDFIVGDNFVTIPDGFSLAPVNVFGRAVILPFPTDSLPPASAGGSKASCDCKGDGDCDVKSKKLVLIGTVLYCTGGCGGECTLTTGTNIGNGDFEISYQTFAAPY